MGEQGSARQRHRAGLREDRNRQEEYDDYRHYWRDEVPMQRYATPDEIAPIALLLASDAGSFITGSVFVVDGGYTLW